MNGLRFAKKAWLLAGASWAALACWAPATAADYDAGTEQQLRDAFAAALASADASSTITLTGNITVSATAISSGGKQITLITQGFTLSGIDNPGGAGGAIAIGPAVNSSGILTISGTLVGGSGSTTGGTGLLRNSLSSSGTNTVVNTGSITGGAGSTSGGIGASLLNVEFLVNNGTVAGGSGASSGGVGVQLSAGATLTNSSGGLIQGGTGQTGSGGTGVFMGGSSRGNTLDNSGTIRGGTTVTGTGGAGIRLQPVGPALQRITNTGVIEGGPGALAISGNAAVNLTLVNSGTIRAGAGQDTAIAFGTNAAAVGTVELHPGSLIIGDVITGNGGNDTLRLAGAGTGILDGGIGAGGQYQNFDIFEKTGSGTWILTGDSTPTSAFQLQQGMLQIGNGGTSGSITGDIANGGTLSFNRSGTYAFAGVISGTGGVQQAGSGTLILSGANTYTGGTAINAGTLAIAQDAALGAASGALTFDGGTLRFDAGFDLSATRAISIAAGGGIINTNGFTTTIASGITGAGALAVTGGGTLILTAENSHTGVTSIASATTLSIGNGGATGSIQGNVANNGTLIVNRSGSVTLPGAISGTGALLVTGGGTVILTGANSYTGGTTILSGTLRIGDGGTTGSIIGDVRNDSPHTLVFDRSDTLLFPGVISGIGAVRQEGSGTTVLTAASSYTGGTTITQGTLQLGTGGTSGSILGDVANNGTLVFNRADTLTFPGVISGTGGVRQDGGGTTVLSGANTYAGPTAVNAGTLRAGAVNAFSPNSAVSVAAGATLDLAGLNQAIAGLTNAGLVSLRGAPGTVLTVNGNLVGQGGGIALNTVLGGDNAATDRLVINGGSATGTTGLRIANIGGTGAQTVQGIRIVETQAGATTASGAFRLDTRLAAGAYEYQLFRGGSTDAEGWYLRSAIIPVATSPDVPAPPGPAIPLFRPEVPLYAPIAGIGRQMGLATLATIGTLHERVGEEENIRGVTGRSPYANGAWARAFGERSRTRWEGDAGSRATGELVGLQAGFDILRTEPYAGGHRDHAGVYVAYTNYNAPSVSGFALGQQGLRVGRLSIEGPSVGAYWTHFGPSGWYVDAVFQANWFDVKARSDFGTSLSTNGTGYAASLEAGYPISVAPGWQVEPQAQIVYQSTSIDRASDGLSSVDWDEDDAWTGRIGARVQYTAQTPEALWQPYAKVNLWHTFSGTDRVSFGGGEPLASRFGQTALEVGAGVTARVTQNLSFYGNADYRWSIDGETRETAVQGTIGVRFNW